MTTPTTPDGNNPAPFRNDADAILAALDFDPEPFRCESAHCDHGNPVAVALVRMPACRPRPCERTVTPLLVCQACLDGRRGGYRCDRCGKTTHAKIVRRL